MPIKGIPPPRQFYVECPNCGIYRVSEQTAHKYLSSELRRKLDDRLAKGAAGAKLKFKKHCFTCKPKSAYHIELVTLRAEPTH